MCNHSTFLSVALFRFIFIMYLNHTLFACFYRGFCFYKMGRFILLLVADDNRWKWSHTANYSTVPITSMRQWYKQIVNVWPQSLCLYVIRVFWTPVMTAALPVGASVTQRLFVLCFYKAAIFVDYKQNPSLTSTTHLQIIRVPPLVGTWICL